MTQSDKGPKKPRIPPSDKNAHEDKRYMVEGMPTQHAIEQGLRRLTKTALRKRWIIETAPVLTNLQRVRYGLDSGATKVDRAVATREYLRAAVARLDSPNQRILLEIVLGVGDSRWDNKAWRHESAKVRREEAGRRFRGGEHRVTFGTIRSHHEPRAIRALAEIIVEDEMEARQEGRYT